jgi:hypothetical protein
MRMPTDRRNFLTATVGTAAAPLLVAAMGSEESRAAPLVPAPNPNDQRFIEAYTLFNRTSFTALGDYLAPNCVLIRLTQDPVIGADKIISYLTTNLQNNPADIEQFNPDTKLWSAKNTVVSGIASWTDNDKGASVPTVKKINYLFRFKRGNGLMDVMFGTPD